MHHSPHRIPPNRDATRFPRHCLPQTHRDLLFSPAPVIKRTSLSQPGLRTSRKPSSAISLNSLKDLTYHPAGRFRESTLTPLTTMRQLASALAPLPSAGNSLYPPTHGKRRIG